VALNCVANGRLRDAGIFKELYIQPAAGDAGGALGAALAVHHIHHAAARTPQRPDAMQGALLGPAGTEGDVLELIRASGAVVQHCANEAELVAATAQLLAEGKVVGWVQGRMEFGPRALGARSILADPRRADMQRVLNLKIKFREGFRPFAPAVLTEEAA